MQVNLFKILAITTAFSTVQSAPVETVEGQVTREQVNETHVNEAVVDDAVRALSTFPKTSYNFFYRLCED
ncbi:hypothetical protein Forpe1208_v013562 [Fusarium oxysporum f. sp. rapae]|uniref:Uncharacterized protein n=1 Tax=Fusarium oxysporum f. sp. rapae TaxID=485398 RepID=A0A8J5NM68_FUSOX|nr:hypothetical protein Forpe1208_v013562 [Fusarium oxysporum f. sp. rapae]